MALSWVSWDQNETGYALLVGEPDRALSDAPVVSDLKPRVLGRFGVVGDASGSLGVLSARPATYRLFDGEGRIHPSLVVTLDVAQDHICPRIEVHSQ